MRPTPTMLILAAVLATSANAEMVHTLRVYDYTQVSDKIVRKAEVLAQQVFWKAGVETEWIHCPAGAGEEARFPACRRPMSGTDVILQILPQTMENRGLSRRAFGYALPDAGGLPARHAYVFLHRVDEVVAKSRRTARCISREVLLAYVVAHEVGHLLLGTDSHSECGVMRGRWSAEDLQEMELGRTAFDAGQARAMRRHVEERGRQLAAESRGEERVEKSGREGPKPAEY